MITRYVRPCRDCIAWMSRPSASYSSQCLRRRPSVLKQPYVFVALGASRLPRHVVAASEERLSTGSLGREVLRRERQHIHFTTDSSPAGLPSQAPSPSRPPSRHKCTSPTTACRRRRCCPRARRSRSASGNKCIRLLCAGLFMSSAVRISKVAAVNALMVNGGGDILHEHLAPVVVFSVCDFSQVQCMAGLQSLRSQHLSRKEKPDYSRRLGVVVVVVDVLFAAGAGGLFRADACGLVSIWATGDELVNREGHTSSLTPAASRRNGSSSSSHVVDVVPSLMSLALRCGWLFSVDLD